MVPWASARDCVLHQYSHSQVANNFDHVFIQEPTTHRLFFFPVVSWILHSFSLLAETSVSKSENWDSVWFCSELRWLYSLGLSGFLLSAGKHIHLTFYGAVKLLTPRGVSVSLSLPEILCQLQRRGGDVQPKILVCVDSEWTLVYFQCQSRAALRAGSAFWPDGLIDALSFSLCTSSCWLLWPGPGCCGHMGEWVSRCKISVSASVPCTHPISHIHANFKSKNSDGFRGTTSERFYAQ